MQRVDTPPLWLLVRSQTISRSPLTLHSAYRNRVGSWSGSFGKDTLLTLLDGKKREREKETEEAELDSQIFKYLPISVHFTSCKSCCILFYISGCFEFNYWDEIMWFSSRDLHITLKKFNFSLVVSFTSSLFLSVRSLVAFYNSHCNYGISKCNRKPLNASLSWENSFMLSHCFAGTFLNQAPTFLIKSRRLILVEPSPI